MIHFNGIQYDVVHSVVPWFLLYLVAVAILILALDKMTRNTTPEDDTPFYSDFT